MIYDQPTSYWGQHFVRLGDRWRTAIHKLHIQKGKVPQFSLNGKLLREAQKAGVVLDVAFTDRGGYVLSKTPKEWLQGRRELRQSQFTGSEAMDYYYHEVPAVFPRDGAKKFYYQAVNQMELFA